MPSYPLHGCFSGAGILFFAHLLLLNFKQDFSDLKSNTICMQGVEHLNIVYCMARRRGSTFTAMEHHGINEEAQQTHFVVVREAVTTNRCYTTTTRNMQISNANAIYYMNVVCLA